MKLQYRRRGGSPRHSPSPLLLSAWPSLLPLAHASPEDPTHGVVGSYTATQPGDIVVDSATHRGYITQYGGPTSSLSVVDTNTGKSVGTIDGGRRLPVGTCRRLGPRTRIRVLLLRRRDLDCRHEEPARSKRRSR